jgi:hypothetical protein
MYTCYTIYQPVSNKVQTIYAPHAPLYTNMPMCLHYSICKYVYVLILSANIPMSFTLSANIPMSLHYLKICLCPYIICKHAMSLHYLQICLSKYITCKIAYILILSANMPKSLHYIQICLCAYIICKYAYVLTLSANMPHRSVRARHPGWRRG